jgi:hypothetical protein
MAVSPLGVEPGPDERGETLDALLWSFAPERDGAPPPASGHDLAAATPESTAMAKELKRRGFRLVGPTTAHSLMEAAGLVNDHLRGLRIPARCGFRTRWRPVTPDWSAPAPAAQACSI